MPSSRSLRGVLSTLIKDHVLLIDLPKNEQKSVDSYRTALRKALKMSKKPPIRDMRPRPDDRQDGAIVQVADMIAGEFRKDPGLSDRYLAAIASRIHFVWGKQKPRR